ncbi:MAG: hypothetical protein GX643_17000 [Acidimicrobiales bacterium]|nr:hypothetical protein [Acidimicrobiales bacterium]
MPAQGPDEVEPIDEVVARLDDEVARRLLVSAAERDEDVMRAVLLAAAGESERLAVLKAAVDDGLRTRRHLDYWGSSAWARDAAPVVDALAEEVTTAPSAELVVLLQRAAGHLVKVILRADDSDGMIGDLCRDVLDLHRRSCDAGVADPQKLAKWMVKFAFDDQDFFEIDPVAYADALGVQGLVVYRREVAKRSEPVDAPEHRSETLHDFYGGFPSFAAKYAAERLAIIDRDVDRLVELLGGDLSSPHQFQRVAEAMVELGDADDALRWARRGIDETSGWQVAKLYDLASELLTEADDLGEVVGFRRHHHERMPSASTYAKLQTAAGAVDAWGVEVERARAVLAERDPVGYIDALLADGEADEAWAVAATGDREVQASQWLRLAEAREPTAPGDAMAVYLRLADDVLARADKRAYRDAIRHLRAARRAATAADRTDEFREHLGGIRERNRRRPSFMAMLDKAGLG